MTKYIQYLKYVLRHKWYVMVECFKCGLIWQGITHDLSKFVPSEFIPYARHFYGKQVRDKSGAYDPLAQGDTFTKAWHHHQANNKHHWQYWVLVKDYHQEPCGVCNCLPPIKTIEIPMKYIKEMVCDWVGAGKAHGSHSPKNDKYAETRKWYIANKDKMILHPDTRMEIAYMIAWEYKNIKVTDVKSEDATDGTPTVRFTGEYNDK